MPGDIPMINYLNYNNFTNMRQLNYVSNILLDNFPADSLQRTCQTKPTVQEDWNFTTYGTYIRTNSNTLQIKLPSLKTAVQFGTAYQASYGTFLIAQIYMKILIITSTLTLKNILLQSNRIFSQAYLLI